MSQNRKEEDYQNIILNFEQSDLANDKKVADLLGLTHEEYLKSKEVK